MPPEQAIRRVAAERLFVRMRGELIGPGEYEGTDEPFHGPADADELNREEIEEIRVRRDVAVDAEVVHAADQSPAEQVLPDPVHGDQRGERVVIAGESFRP